MKIPVITSPRVTATFSDGVLAALNGMPDPVSDLLTLRGYSVYLGSTHEDIWQSFPKLAFELENDRFVRMKISSGQYEEAIGLCIARDKQPIITLTEFKNKLVGPIAVHEVGHAVDDMPKPRLSTLPEFLRAFEIDKAVAFRTFKSIGALTTEPAAADIREMIDRQLASDGPREIWANHFAHLMGQTTADNLAYNFSKTLEIVKRNLIDLGLRSPVRPTTNRRHGPNHTPRFELTHTSHYSP